jgi:hypothetical protein
MPDYKTTDYCGRCGESPESGTHLLGANRHDYVPPTADDRCTCGKPRGASVHAHGRANAITGHAFEAVLSAKLPPQAPGGVRVKVEDRPGMPQFGVLVGMLVDEHSDILAVVRLDHYGLMLKAVHPSKVMPVTPEEEETYKP